MSWSLVLIAISEVASSQGLSEAKRCKTRADQKRKNQSKDGIQGEGGLAEQSNEAPKSEREMKELAFRRIWEMHSSWAGLALEDAVSYARMHQPRVEDNKDDRDEMIREVFKDQLWPSLLGRGWKVLDEDDEDGLETYVYEKRKFRNASAVMNEVMRIHPELTKIVVELLNKIEQSRLQETQISDLQRAKDLAITPANVDLKSLQVLIKRYSPMQILHDRKRSQNRVSLKNKTLTTCYYVKAAIELVNIIEKKDDKLVDVIGIDDRHARPHPLWTHGHDETLIHSVVKHGWVDVDSNLKDIVNDNEIKWGFPFELTDNAPIQRISEEEMNNLRETAKRAATLLNEKSKILEALTGFNKQLGE